MVEAIPTKPEAAQPEVSRRALLGASVTGALAAVGVRTTSAAENDGREPLLRPPGSVPESQFLEQCIRCDACLKVCPSNVLQPLGFERGFNGLWTPVVKPDWAGCAPSCNACGQACPTGAIRDLVLDEKRHARIGLAEVNTETCLPWEGSEACQLCVDECRAAGYDAIEFRQAHPELDEVGQPIAGTGFLAPAVVNDKCVGCGLCQTRCVAINVKERGVLGESAIIVRAGPGKEDRIASGSYRDLRVAEAAEQERKLREAEAALGDFY